MKKEDAKVRSQVERHQNASSKVEADAQEQKPKPPGKAPVKPPDPDQKPHPNAKFMKIPNSDDYAGYYPDVDGDKIRQMDVEGEEETEAPEPRGAQRRGGGRR